MKPGDLVRLKDGPNRTYNVHDSVGLVISAYVRRVSEGKEYYEVEIMFTNKLFRHPGFPSDLLEVIDETG